MIDVLFLAQNRLEFTKVCLANLIENTDWSIIHKLYIYDDSSTDGTLEFVRSYNYGPLGPKVHFQFGDFGSPVAIMNHYLSLRDVERADIFAKIDSDTMVPPGWLTETLRVLDKAPWLHFLGIEAFRPVQPGTCSFRLPDNAGFVGGIGLFRSSAFAYSLPRPDGRQGFTQFQEHNEWIRKAWLNPALPVFLLDWVPREPWRSLTQEYVAKGWSRDWADIFPQLCPYPEERKDLWSWWCE